MTHGSTPHSPVTGRSSAASLDAQEAFDRGVAFEQRDELLAAEEAYRAADDLGHPTAAVRLGVLLEERDDFDGAEQAFRRADARGDAVGAFHLAWMLQEGGDLAGAEQAYRRAETRGHPGAHSNLRMMRAAYAIGLPAPSEPPVDEPAPRRPADDVPPPRAHAAPPAAAPREPEIIHEAEIVDEPLPPTHPFAPGSEISSEAADQLAIALAAMSGQAAASEGEGELSDFAEQPTVELSRPLRAVARGDAARTRNAPHPPDPPRTGRAAEAPRRGRAGRGSAKDSGRTSPTPASQGLARRVLGVVLPVVAFGIAFSAGASTRDHAPASVSLAPAVRLSGADVRLAPVTSVPTPAALPKPRTPAKPKTGAVSAHTATGPTDRGVVVPLPPATGTTVRVRTPTSHTSSTTSAGTSGGTPVKAGTPRSSG